MANGVNFRLCEIEFYLNTPGHPDPFVHCDEDQHHKCRWYFHKQNGKSYKSGTYKGLDITFGYKDNTDVYGGILIRSIKNLDNSVFTEGSCRVVNILLETTEYTTIQELVDNGLKSNTSIDGTKLLYLEQTDTLKNKVIYQGPRVGLTLKKPSKRKYEYIMRDYRYLTYPKKTKKYRSTVILNLYYKKENIDNIEDNIEDNTGCKKRFITKYINLYDKGNTLAIKDFYNKRLNNSDICMLYGLLKNCNK